MKVRTHAVAKAAYTRVAGRRDKKNVDRKKYGALAHKLPGMILENGLAQATGFLLAKGKDKSVELALLADLRAVLRAAETTAADDRSGENDLARRFHEEIIGSDLEQTLILTRRALEAGGWLKRYAQGVLGVDATGDRIQQKAGDESSGGDG